MRFIGVLAHDVFPKTFRWHVFACLFCVRVPDIRTITFCWIWGVILGPFSCYSEPGHGKTAKRNTQKKKTKKTSAGSPEESRKLQKWGGDPLIKK